ncbi:MAG: hypothetical protein IPM20_08540 [Gammaproteobacteria bacterium]|nr:hypothetical protein [Gammaproteobacteria bacterium]
MTDGQGFAGRVPGIFSASIGAGFVCLVLAVLWLPAIANAAGPVLAIGSNPARQSEIFAIQLTTADELPGADGLPDIPQLRQYRLYALRAEPGKPFRYRLRLGFFADMNEAATVKARIEPHFPGSWILKVSAQEARESIASSLNNPPLPQPATPAPAAPEAPLPAPQPPAAAAAVVATTAAPEDRMTALMESGRQAVARGDYPLAIRIYTKVLESPDSEYARDALEYLGLARERNGQAAHAKAEYERYLELYPKDPGADRVRQRLAGLLTAREAPREKLPEQKTAAGKPMEWNGSGSFSQYYRRDATTIDGAGETVTQSALMSDLDLSARGRNDDYDIRARFNGGYTYDFLSDGEDLSRISNLYIDVSHRRAGVSGRVGRQTRSSGGVFGRFDGMLMSYQTSSWGRFNVVGGYPVERSTDTGINRDKVFYGMSADLPAWRDHWDYSVYAITQTAGDVSDRRALGGEARYLDDARSLFALLDYDTQFQTINIFSLLGNWAVDDWTTYNFALNQSRSPFLGASNALIGQTAQDIDELLGSYSEEEIQDLALDRTAISRAVSGGISRTFTDKLQLTADVTVSSLSGTPASGGVPATDATGNEYLYSLQLIGNGIIRSGDLAILGLMYSDASTTNTTTLNLNTRYPVTSLLRINPRLRLDYRQFDRGNGEQWITTPSIRFDYRYRRNIDLDADIGLQWSDRDIADTTEKSSGYYVYLGYNLGF